VKKIILLFGKMSELGVTPEKRHKDVGRYLADKNIEYLFTYVTEQNNGRKLLRMGFPLKSYSTLIEEPLHQRLEKT
jgi:UDP-N-acetylmuramyl pentapeptide synthase